MLFIIVLLPLFTYTVIRSTEKKGYDREMVLNMIILCGAVFFAGARALFVVVNWKHFSVNPADIIRFRDGGFSVHGGLLLAGMAATAYMRFNFSDVYTFGDIVAPFVALSISIARIGCFLRGCCFGKISRHPWAVTFSPQSPAYAYQSMHGLLVPGTGCTLAVHPSQLYESGASLLLSLMLFSMQRKDHPAGRTMLTFIAGYSLIRLFLDRFRADIQLSIWGVKSVLDIINIFLLIISLNILIRSGKSNR